MKQTKDQVASKYARALLEVSKEKKELELINSEIDILHSVIENNPNLIPALSANTLSKQEKETIFTSLKESFSSLMQDFLNLLADYKRLNILSIVVDDFKSLYNEEMKIIDAHAITTYSLDDSQINSLKESLKKRYNAAEINISNDIDQTIMGGVILKVGNEIIDGSVKNKLANIKKILLQK